MEEQNTILFHLTLEQARILCSHFNRNIDSLEDYEICELLDNYIDELNR